MWDHTRKDKIWNECMQGDIGSTYQEENNKNTLRVVWTCVDDTEGTSEKNRSHEFYSNEKE